MYEKLLYEHLNSFFETKLSVHIFVVFVWGIENSMLYLRSYLIDSIAQKNLELDLSKAFKRLPHDLI